MPVSDSIEPQILSCGNCFLLGESCSFLFQSSANIKCIWNKIYRPKNANPSFVPVQFNSSLAKTSKCQSSGIFAVCRLSGQLKLYCTGNQNIRQPAPNLNVEHCILILKTNLEDTKSKKLLKRDLRYKQ